MHERQQRQQQRILPCSQLPEKGWYSWLRAPVAFCLVPRFAHESARFHRGVDYRRNLYRVHVVYKRTADWRRTTRCLSTENVKSLWTICFVSSRRDLIGRAPRLKSFGATFIRSSLWMRSQWFSLLANQMPMPFRQDGIFQNVASSLHAESHYFWKRGPVSFHVLTIYNFWPSVINMSITTNIHILN